MRKLKFWSVRIRRFAIKILIVILSVIFLFKLIKVQKINIEKEKELENITKKVEEKNLENAYLQKKIEDGIDEEYLENYARENLGMTRINERVIVDVPNN